MSSAKFEFEEFEPLAMALTETWPSMAEKYPLSEFALKIFYQALCDWPVSDVEAALMKHIKSEKGTFRPAPADIIKHLPKAKAEISPIERAKVVWSQITLDIASHGSGRDKATKCPIALELIGRWGGWRDLSGKTSEQLVWIGKEFVDIYQPTLKIAQAEKVRARIAATEHAKLTSTAGQLTIGAQNATT